ncbi:jg16978 [Pararge aegeria aegeria]|uniref:Jg16978 protein n=1 Tax=Pararge aegeria aegeria TaxID=348720 RepID=A0A8S4RHC3_9NEOP|nr:jg16978 [Pararge aegeria aegeria]
MERAMLGMEMGGAYSSENRWTLGFQGVRMATPHRQKQWLKLACRDDLLDKDMDKLRKTLRFCSRHFPPNTIVNRHLTQEALPSKSLPGSIDEGK